MMLVERLSEISVAIVHRDDSRTNGRATVNPVPKASHQLRR